MIVKVYCGECKDYDLDTLTKCDYGEIPQIEMKTTGQPYFNVETKTQYQNYKCPACYGEVAVLIKA